MIRFHNIEEDSNNIVYKKVKSDIDWDNLKNIFTEYEFNSIVSRDKTWNNFVNTFSNLERNL